MNETSLLSDSQDDAFEKYSAEPPWETLKKMRQSKGIELETLASQLKVSASILQYLEQGRFDLLPKGSFSRTLVINICRHLKIESHASEALMQAWPAAEKDPLIPLSIEIKNASSTVVPDEKIETTRPTPWSLKIFTWLVLLAIVVGVWWVYSPSSLINNVEKVESIVQAEQAVTRQEESPAPAAQVTRQSLPEPSSAPAASASAAATTAAPTAAASAVASSAKASESTLVLRAQGSSWVSIRAQDGTSVFSGQMAVGQTKILRTRLPVWVTVGHAPSIVLLKEGQVFDFQAFAKNNVARFEVK